jgi:ABC-type protease/lipase transport system fused ATPase/permease subunit
MLRDALQGIGTPAAWLNSEAYVDDAKKAAQAQARAQQQLGAMQQASEVAKNMGAAAPTPA